MNSSSAPTGVLLTNLGTPVSPEPEDVRAYLKEFLSDRRVVNVPLFIWWPILNFVILNTRPKRSAKAYKKIWTDQGSPLLSISVQQAELLQRELDHHGNYIVELAMRYGQPSIAAGVQSLKEQGVTSIIVLPAYPQFSHTTTSSTRDAVDWLLKQDNTLPNTVFINEYHNEPGYIDALANSVREHWAIAGKAEKVLMSFHGIPQEYADAGDPYPEQCRHTASLLAEALNLEKQQWLLTFQSRLGRKPWLQPYTDKTLASLAQSGVRSVQIMCPGFSADCLETLEEIQMENRDVFLEAGGERYEYIPCLNTRDEHIQLYASLVQQSMREKV